MDYFDFDKDKVVEAAKMWNPDIDVLFISARTGEGIPQLAEWILNQVSQWNA
jgi:hydrogenase nickel incorporation protein HypB